MKRIVILLLSAVLLFGSFGCDSTPWSAVARDFLQIPPDEKEIAFHTDRTFSELTASGIDAALEKARAKELLFRIERGEIAGEDAQRALDARAEAYAHLGTDAALAYVHYCKDVTDTEKKQAYDSLAAARSAIACDLTDAALLLSSDPSLKDRYDQKTVNALRRADTLSDPSVLPLLERERALVGRYESLSEDLKLSYRGREWTGDAILSDPSLSDEDFSTLYEAYLDLFNREAGAIFLDLVSVRKEIAATLGFASYADYVYACFDRDYSPADAAKLSERIRTEIVPAFAEMRGDFYAAAAQLYGLVFEKDETLDRVKEAAVSILPELSEPWDYLFSHEMVDFGTDERRMPGSFTVYLDDYGTPFLFSSWTYGFDMPSTVLHEFGHCAAYYLNAEAMREGSVLDLAEIDSQGLELLGILRYDTIYDELCGAAETVQLFYALYALIDGCLEDTFQQFAYGEDDLTLEGLNAEYGRLCAAYGLDSVGVEALSWTRIPHTFQSPFYYVSYATSMTSALQILALARKDPAAAAKAYRSILYRDGGSAFRETLKKAGLWDPFSDDGILGTEYDFGRSLRSA